MSNKTIINSPTSTGSVHRLGGGGSKLFIAGIGPGSPEDITPAVLQAVQKSDVVIGYKYYFQFIRDYLRPGTECIDSGMRQERQRAEEAVNLAKSGKTVCVISSGDAGIYGMAPLIFQLVRQAHQPCEPDMDIEVLPGISAFQKAASLLGAPIGHDTCIISLSDLMTPWAVIERRIKAAAYADFVTAVYNPKSNGRYWQLYRLIELFKKERSLSTPIGYVRQAGREEQEVHITTLGEFDPEQIDMFTVIIIGNSQSYVENSKFITPRGYFDKYAPKDDDIKIGQSIMIKSFQTIRKELSCPDIETWKLWPMLHAIHTTADFEMEKLLWMDDEATKILYEKVKTGQIKTIVTDVSMVASGIRKGALKRLGIEVRTYINDPRAAEMAYKELPHFDRLSTPLWGQGDSITRAQAGIRLAIEDYPEGKGVLFAFGNAPTALLELCDLIQKGRCKPEGIIGAPVGFVHVEESKHAAKACRDIPKIIIEGRKGGSNLAATLVNSILTYDDAEQLMPGRDV